jgi:membrane-associated phospholipid phosphatase
MALKQGYRVVDHSSFTGLITFPSYHAAAAVIFSWALWPTRLRWPLLVVNVLMTASAIIVGSHYLIDIIAGCVVAAIAISVAGTLVNPSASAKNSPLSLPQAQWLH